MFQTTKQILKHQRSNPLGGCPNRPHQPDTVEKAQTTMTMALRRARGWRGWRSPGLVVGTPETSGEPLNQPI
jgi:hypothetical protein